MAKQRIEDPGRSDAELITAVRAGDTPAYEELYRRHADGARAAARGLTRDRSEADDLVAEAFARVLSVLQRGGGPEMAFRPYLLATVRNVFLDRRRKDERLDLADDVPEDFNRSLLAAAAAEDSPDRQMVATAFASLPERWQLVLWHTEVEGRSAAEVAPLLGLAPNAVAALAYRAREGLRQAYLNAHVQATVPPGCRPTIDKLGAYVRDDISARDRRKVEYHLAECERCTAIVAELGETSTRLRGVLIPLVLGVPASVYLANIGGAGVVAALASRARQLRSNPAAMVVVAAATVLVVGTVGFAATRLADGGSDDTVAPAPSGPAPRGEGGGDGGGDGEAGADAAGDDAPSQVTQPPPATAAADVTSAVPPVRTSTAGDRTSGTSPRPPVTRRATRPTARPAPAGRRPAAPGPPAPGPTVGAPSTPTAAPPPSTVAPVPALSVSIGAPSPAIAGFQVALPLTVTNGAAPAAAAFGRGAARRVPAAVPAAAPFVEVVAPIGATFAGPDPATSTCSVAGARTRCSLPALADGASTSVALIFDLADELPGELVFTTAVGDGTGAARPGPSVTVTVAPAAGVDELFVGRMAVTTIGNTVVTCAPLSPDDPVCPAARAGTATPPVANDKQNLMMVRVVDGTVAGASTSSSATLALPPAAPVVHALLVWAGELAPGIGGEPPVDAGAAGAVRLVTPGGTSAVTADVVSSTGTMYRASADVTALVAAGGAGRYTVADVQTATGPAVFGSWALLVVHRDAAAPHRVVALSTEFATVTSGQTATIALGGFPATPRPTALTLLSTEGDLGLVPERVLLNGALLSDAANPPNNVFNGSINLPYAREPAYANNFGLDIDRFDLTASGPTLTLVAESQVDRVVLGPVAMAVDL